MGPDPTPGGTDTATPPAQPTGILRPSPNPPLSRAQGVLLGIVLVAVGWLATVAPSPPAPLPAAAPPGDFSAERAWVHVQAIAPTTHPLGSPANAAVRDYIVARLSALGLTPEVQSFPYRSKGRALGGANVMARVPGLHRTRQPPRAVALVCHYDSVPTGPGASDDGAGVAALLETARALMAGPALRNDVMLLFTDGEEVGLDGARAFALGCPWMKDIGVVLNFEARGVSGPVFMFETSTNNGEVIREFAKAAPRPVANSLMYEIYRRMPNDTDFTIFKEARLPGLNFAFIGDPQHYHARTDDLAHFNLRSLQHAGGYALSLARQFGNLGPAQLEGPDAVYFDLFGRWLVHYPVAWAIPLALLATVLFLGVTRLGIKRGEVSLGQLGLGGLACGMNLLIVGIAFRHGLDLVRGLSPGATAWFGWFLGWPYWFAAVGLTVAVNAALHVVLRRWLTSTAMALGALFWWLGLTVACAVWMPGASYVSFWPLLFGLLGVVAIERAAETPGRRFAWLAVSALPVLSLAAPLVQGFYVALGPRAMFVPMVVLALLLGALSLQIEAVSRAWRWILPAAGVVVALVAAIR